MLLHDIAHCRAGDKGDTATLSLFPYRDEDFALLVREVTADRVREHLADHIRGEVVRYALPNLCGLQFVCGQALDGGVTTSLALDTHGKTLSARLLSLPLPGTHAQRCCVCCE
ncbi:AtuA-related protein [Saccharopolyspora sp. 5N708]|uniref:AtuA-related protein n=1 Tax=Saccharopolyspora sp. 5N708 TaxID=3457424 RepID=UPI003FCFA9C9